ncbi:hypothetical protein B4U79_07473 [Dinothrombium tinctorium]|uniref:Mon2 C-terminal domain-containing protein n=1 Tax=Dinothrombium tinctorium TaxID=1965070 RepID=A0A443RM80_9ACAR|nr:hypothetical protein B4U79_07473 [Dinothrombium tinctorium]
MKYSCPSQTTWKLAVNVLLNVLQIGLPIARQHASDFIGIWADLANCLEAFLFPNTRLSPNATLEDQQFDEALDVKVVEVIRDSILPFAGQMPKEFVLQIVSILNKGSIHSATSDSPVGNIKPIKNYIIFAFTIINLNSAIGKNTQTSVTYTDSTRKLREEFARSCFETLLQFSFLGPKGNPNLFIQSTGHGSVSEVGLVNKLAVTSLLQRFHEVVIKYVEDEKLSGKCPLPRHRMGEISFVLQALATLASSLKKVPPETVEDGVWDQLISLYPHLVDCTLSNCAQVNRSLREVLHEYKDLLSPPHHSKNHTKLIVNGT